MFALVLKILLAIFGMLIGSSLLKDLMNYLFWHRHYKSQGISYTYIPFFGLNYFYIVDLHRFFEKDISALDKYKLMHVRKGDMIAKFRQLSDLKKTEDIIAINFEKGSPMLLIKNLDLVLEFLLKENEVTRRIISVDLPTDLGFALKNGEHGLKRRSILAKLFYPERLNDFCPTISLTIERKLEELMGSFAKLSEEFPKGYEQRLDSKSSDGFKSINARAVITSMFYDMVENILFGSEREVKIDGMSLPEAANLLLKFGMSDAIPHPLNILSGGLASKYRLIECSRKADTLNAKIYEVLGKEIDARCKLEAKNLGVNIMDLLIQHNKTAVKDDVLSKSEIIQNCLVFYVAAVDSSKNASEFILHNFSRDQKVQS